MENQLSPAEINGMQQWFVIGSHYCHSLGYFANREDAVLYAKNTGWIRDDALQEPTIANIYLAHELMRQIQYQLRSFDCTEEEFKPLEHTPGFKWKDDCSVVAAQSI